MKLLSKKEVDQSKASERARDVQEGLKLAKRVDALRETQAEEEASLARFREKTLAIIHEETTKAAEKRDILLKEVSGLEKRRKEALKPLDKEEERLEAFREELSDRERTLEVDERNSGLLKAETKQKLKAASDALKRAETKERQLADLVASKENDRKQQTVFLQEAQKVRDAALSLKKQVVDDLKTRDTELAVREKNLELRAETFTRHEKALEKREIRLKDREEKLARNIKRLKT